MTRIHFLNVQNGDFIFAGDSSEKTWNYILETHNSEVSNADLLIAPHHGRKSGGNDSYLDVLKPTLTLFGNALSKDLDYASWNNRNLCHITNNRAGNVVVEIYSGSMKVYVSNENYAKKCRKAENIPQKEIAGKNYSYIGDL